MTMPHPNFLRILVGDPAGPLGPHGGDWADENVQRILAEATHNAEVLGGVKKLQGHELTWADLASTETEALDRIREAIWRRNQRTLRPEMNRVVSRRRDRVRRARVNQQMNQDLRNSLTLAAANAPERGAFLRTLTRDRNPSDSLMMLVLMARRNQQIVQLHDEEILLESARGSVRARLAGVHKQFESERERGR